MRVASATVATPVEISIVVPVHNEAAGIEAFFAQLLPVLERLGTTWEVICVNDGSTDATLDLLLEFYRRTPAIKVINLSRNFGKDVALSAGFDYAGGAAVIPIDAVKSIDELTCRLSASEGADPRAHETAVSLGASPLRAALTTLLEVRFAVVAGVFNGFGRVISEVGCAMMVGGNIAGVTRNMPTAIALETSKGDFAQGIALGVVLMLFALGISIALGLLQGRGGLK